MNHRSLAIFSAILLNLLSTSLHAQSMDVDQADTIDFQSFHKDKKEAIKVWDKKSNEPTKAYSDQAEAAKGPTATPDVQSKNATTSTTATTNSAPVAAENIRGKRFEIRERYTLTRSTQTPYSAFYVIEPLYKQAAQLCAKGWKKLSERSEPIEQDFYLYFDIECL